MLSPASLAKCAPPAARRRAARSRGLRATLFGALLTSLVATALPGAAPGARARPGHSELVAAGPDGRLTYHAYTAGGDTLPDFSHCGYAGGDRPVPDAPVKETIYPDDASGDDTPRIQAALDRVAALPPDRNSMRGAVLLARGRYRCAGTLRLRVGGVVLRGAGDGDDGTIVTATARGAQPVVVIGGDDHAPPEEPTPREITDLNVPVGASSFAVADTHGLSVGDTVFVVRRGNAAWIRAIGMDRITPRPNAPAGSTRQWAPFELRFDRVITAIDGRRVTVDAPIACAIEERWGGGALVRYRDPDRIEHCGVERLRAESIFDESKTVDRDGERVHVDEDHADYLVVFGNVKNAWTRHVTTVYFAHGPARIDSLAKWITVENCRALKPVSLITGGRRYPYAINGQLVLVRECTSWGARHAFVFGARVPGPNAFVECRSEHDYATSEPHHRWSVGGLYDNVEARLAFQDRQWMGSGHGWSGANYVAWNCRGELVCQQPPTAQNFAIGFTGRRGKAAFPRADGWWESEGTPVEPRSLYATQLQVRRSPSYPPHHPSP